MRKLYFLSSLIVILISSCSRDDASLLSPSTSEGTITDGIYSSEQFGWTIKIPPSWEIVTSNTDFDTIRREGRKMMNEAEVNVPEANKPIKLLFAKRDDSSLAVIAEKILPRNDVSIMRQTELQKEMILKTYENSGISIIDSKVDEGDLGGQPCGITRIAINADNPFGQVYYTFKRRGYWLSMVVTFTDPILRDEIYEALNGCTFN